MFGASSIEAQQNSACQTDRTISTLVGAGLGAAIGAIPATIVHRHDQTSSHRIVAGSVVAGALIGFVASSRDRPCANSRDASRVADAVVAGRAAHARRGALAGALIGGAVGGTFYQTGCTNEPCHERATRTNLMLFSAGEGLLAGGILGSLVGWAWPAGR